MVVREGRSLATPALLRPGQRPAKTKEIKEVGIEELVPRYNTDYFVGVVRNLNITLQHIATKIISKIVNCVKTRLT